jgi:hypothetical protein
MQVAYRAASTVYVDPHTAGLISIAHLMETLRFYVPELAHVNMTFNFAIRDKVLASGVSFA